MTEATKLENLNQQIAEMKAEVELEELKSKKDQVTEPVIEFSQERLNNQQDVESARIRGWAYFVGAYVSGPIWPCLVANRTGQWAPFWVGLGLGVATLPAMFLDLGILSSIPAAAAGTAMMSNKTKQKRRELGVVCAEEADMLRFRKSF